jgi:K+-transporting ATPase ATPase C chain
MIRNELLISLRTTALTLLALGILYPLAVTGAALAFFPHNARGGMATDDSGAVVGAELLAQAFGRPGYLQPRPSAVGYDGAGSGGSNLGPTSKALHDRAEKEVQRLRQENPDAQGPVPAELVSASASGLDPHLSPEAALWQVRRIAHARGVDEARVRAVIEAQLEGRDLWVLGEPRVNVLRTNLALDRHFGKQQRAER